MNSIRLKLILVVSIITISSFATVLVSNLYIVKEEKRSSIETSNSQVSELVSRSVITQIAEYRRDLSYILKGKLSNPEYEIEKEFYPDYIWVQVFDWDGNSLYEWSDEERLSKEQVPLSRLIGKRKQDQLFSQAKQVLSRNKDWMLISSTVHPFMPSFLLVSPFETDGSEASQYVVLAEIFAEPLYNQIQARKGQELALIDSNQNILLSTQPNWDPSQIILKNADEVQAIKDLKVGEHSQKTLSYRDRESQLTWFYKFQNGTGLSLILQEPVSNLTASQKRVQFQSALVGIAILIIAINLIVIFASRITSPLKKLIESMTKVGKGEFKTTIKVKTKDEIGQLANVFNRMIQSLEMRDKEIEKAKEKLIQSEKMSAFGQMSAGIAHEVKNPLAGILGYAQIAKKKLEDRPELQAHMEIIEKETTRCKEIVENLMKFARQEKASMQRIDLNKTVQDSVRLVEHQISVSGIKIVQMFALEGNPIFVKGNANQIQQVMLNLMLNAQHAMENKGTLTVSTHYDEKNNRMMIVVSDTGCGMPADVQARIFEPFYTTKGVGKGTGLGLSVSLGIIKDHKGIIDIDSEPGQGTSFTISIPCDEKATEKPEGKVNVA